MSELFQKRGVSSYAKVIGYADSRYIQIDIKWLIAEGRRPECKYKVNNNSRIARKRSPLVTNNILCSVIHENVSLTKILNWHLQKFCSQDNSEKFLVLGIVNILNPGIVTPSAEKPVRPWRPYCVVHTARTMNPGPLNVRSA